MKSNQITWGMEKRKNITGRRLFRHGILSLVTVYLCTCVYGMIAYANGGADVLANLVGYGDSSALHVVVSGHVEAAAGTPVAFYLNNEEGETGHYAQSALDNEGAYCFDFMINPKYGSGTFTYTVKPKDLAIQSGTIEVVDGNDLAALLDYIRLGVPSEEGLQAQMAQMNLGINLPFYNQISLKDLSEVLYAELSSGDTLANVEELYQWIQQGVIVAGVNVCPDNLFRNGRFQYAEQIGLDAESTGIYATELTADGLAAVQNGLKAADYRTAAECTQTLRQLILTNCITHHVSKDLEKAASNLLRYGTELGLDLSKATGRETEIVRAIVNAGSGTLSELQSAYSIAVSSVSPGGGISPGSGIGQGGKGSAAGGGFGYHPSVTPTTTNENQAPNRAGFVDMADFAWAEEAVTNLKSRGAINGKSETTFAPAEAVTREEFVKIIMESFGLMPAEAENGAPGASFADVNIDEWYAPYVVRAAALGVVTGLSDEEFGIGQQISRQDMATLVFRILRYKDGSFDADLTDVSFTDTEEIAAYAKVPALLLKKLEILSGYPDGSFRPLQTANRAEAAQMVYRILTLLEKK